MILKNVDDIRHLIDEFSSFSRLPSPILENINYNKFIEDTYNFFKTSYPDIKFDKTSVSNIDKKLKIYADEKQLRQVIGNVIKNSSENFQENKLLFFLFSERESLIMALNKISFISAWTALLPIILMLYIKTNKKNILY